MQYRLTIDVFAIRDETAAAGKALGGQRNFSRCKVAVREGDCNGGRH